jgi:hypothetical protein
MRVGVGWKRRRRRDSDMAPIVAREGEGGQAESGPDVSIDNDSQLRYNKPLTQPDFGGPLFQDVAMTAQTKSSLKRCTFVFLLEGVSLAVLSGVGLVGGMVQPG